MRDFVILAVACVIAACTGPSEIGQPRTVNTVSKEDSAAVLLTLKAMYPDAIEDPDEDPVAVGGDQALLQRVRYPWSARRKGIEGRVYVTFVVDENGAVLSPMVTKGIGGGLDKESVRALSGLKHKPGRKNGRSVKVIAHTSVLFKLSDPPAPPETVTRMDPAAALDSLKAMYPDAISQVDEDPVLIGGPELLLRRLRYPVSARRANIQGRVFLAFVVDESGRVLSPIVTEGPSDGLDTEAVRVIGSAEFIPARKDDKPVKVVITRSILFRIW